MSTAIVPNWWSALSHGGLLIAPSRIVEHFAKTPPALDWYAEDRLRSALGRLDAGRKDALGELLDATLESTLGLGRKNRAETGVWTKGSNLGPEYTHRDATGVAIKPRRVWRGPFDAELAVFVDDAKRIGVHRGRRSYAQTVEWLRATGRRLALLTNGHQWRLVHAGLEADAWAESDCALWFEEGSEGDALLALRTLLSPDSLIPAKQGATPRLLQAIDESRRGQSELSATLGENVRTAVERLIVAHGPALSALLDSEPTPGARAARTKDLYIAACRVVMRLVVLLFSEAREDLLPLDHAVYRDGYSLAGLRDELERAAGSSSKGRMRERTGAWPRLLALFRLMHRGSTHQDLPIPRYGGGLFAPGDPHSADPILRAVHALETASFGSAARVTDLDVFTILRLLTRCRVKIRQGKANRNVVAPVDFSDLSSEYIGILYEGLLDFELKRVDGEHPVIFLGLGDQPALALDRLEGLEDSAIKGLVEKLGKPSRASAGDEDADSEDAEDGADDEESADDDADSDDQAGGDLFDPSTGDNSSGEDDSVDDTDDIPDPTEDLRGAASQRAEAWARRAIDIGKLVAKARSQKPEKLREREAKVDAFAKRLIDRTILPGEWYLVRYGGTRKGSGTYYTKPQLAIPTVQRTLRPLCYDAPLGADGEPDIDAPAARWIPKTPEAILALKVCDPACGSGSFPVAALRFLTDALYASLHHHQRISDVGDSSVARLADGDPALRLEDELLPCRKDDDRFEPRLRARLRRHLVERCIHGVDYDPLAVDLCRVALWIETLDRNLPFTFLDHRIKCGNALVGTWFDRFRDYPVMAWEREGGDKTHTKGVHCEKGAWESAIKVKKKEVQASIKERLRKQSLMFDEPTGASAEVRRKQLAQLVEDLHAIPIHDQEAREIKFRNEIEPALVELRRDFDEWCALWFWPADRMAIAPLSEALGREDQDSLSAVSELREAYRFFHWELEFPDVFRGPDSGFDAVVGNPPWEIQKPNSKEFFSNHDPLYRALGKQEALRRQTELFREDAAIEREWIATNAHFKALSNWVKHAGSPFGDPQEGGASYSFGGRAKGGNETLHSIWRARRASQVSFSDPEHPFRHQGSADINTYKLFLEQSYALLSGDGPQGGGRVGMITPSGIYTDKGTGALRELFLDHSSWEWVFGFENRFKVFDIHRSFKFAATIVRKGGRTSAVRSAFMRHELSDWARAEEVAVPYTAQQVRRFSPGSRAFLEVSNRRDLEILEKIYSNSVLLGDESEDGWGVQYRTEFHMSNDSKLFPPREKWEAKGYEPDEYSRWLDTTWHPRTPDSAAPPDTARHELEPGVILSRDGERWTTGEEIGDVALPLYEGRMVGQFASSAKGWVSGKGRAAVWREIGAEEGVVEPQYVMSIATLRAERGDMSRSTRLAFMDVSSTTNSRTFIGTALRGQPCGHKVPTLRLPEEDAEATLQLLGVLGSFAYDWNLRRRLGGQSLIWATLAETAVPSKNRPVLLKLANEVLALVASPRWQADLWTDAKRANGGFLSTAPGRAALAAHERLRKRVLVDVLAMVAFELVPDDVRWVLSQTDLPQDQISSNPRQLEPRGFWRCQKRVDPELRHTVLTQVAFVDLQSDITAAGGDTERGITAFLARNDGEGWMLPETLRLADYDLGHDERAKQHQPVASRLGPRFYDWQLAQSPEDSWRECELHAKNLAMEVRPARA
jgi:Eco57I restriction-modification methylase